MGAPVFRVKQEPAVFRGFELETNGSLMQRGQHTVNLRLWSDYTFAEHTDSAEPLPRIPPMRLGGELSYGVGALGFQASLMSVSKQDRVAEHETTTDGYTILGGSVHYRFFAAGTVHILTLQGRNLTNAIARPHTSILKDAIPLPGRDIRLTYRLYL